MRTTSKTWRLQTFLLITLLHFNFMELCQGSVLPRPNIRQQSTTQIANLDKNYTGERTIVIVTSSELPKQIPPPPTPTKPHRLTPKYAVTSPQKEPSYKKNESQNKGLVDQYHLVL